LSSIPIDSPTTWPSRAVYNILIRFC
jgi:hypothetical protein